MAIWNILWSFGIFYVYLVCGGFLLNFSCFGLLWQKNLATLPFRLNAPNIYAVNCVAQYNVEKITA
jgi:hypothetical protein